MNLKQFLVDSLITFGVTLVIAVSVTFLWNVAFHGTGSVDWETSFRLAIILGFTLPSVRAWESMTAKK